MRGKGPAIKGQGCHPGGAATQEGSGVQTWHLGLTAIVRRLGTPVHRDHGTRTSYAARTSAGYAPCQETGIERLRDLGFAGEEAQTVSKTAKRRSIRKKG